MPIPMPFLVVVLVLLLVLLLLVRRMQAQKADGGSPKPSKGAGSEWDAMDSNTFARFAGGLFVRLGFRVDQAAPVVHKNDVSIALVALHAEKSVGAEAVQAAVAVRDANSCDGAVVVSNRDFDSKAKAAAKKADVVLWNRSKLVEALKVADELSPQGPVPVRAEAVA